MLVKIFLAGIAATLLIAAVLGACDEDVLHSPAGKLLRILLWCSMAIAFPGPLVYALVRSIIR